MKCKLLTLLTCFHALSPTDRSASYGEAGGSAVLSSSVDTTPRHGLGAVTGIPAVIIAKFLACIPTPTNAAEACEVVRLIAEGESFAILRGISAVSREVGESFECTEIREQLEAAVKEAIPKAIQILNDATDGVCDLEGEESRTKIDRMIRQILTSTNHSAKLQAFNDLAQRFKSLAGAYKLRIKGGCEDPQATKHKLVRALWGAAHALRKLAILHTKAGNHTDAAKVHEKRAALHQEAAEVYSAEDSEKQAEALQGAASALRNAAVSHHDAGNHVAAADCLTASAALSQRCAQIYGVLGYRENQAEVLQGAASALRNAAVSHHDAGNHVAAVECYTASAALSQRCAEMYHGLENDREQADELKSAANALFDAALLHNHAGNHAGAIDCYTASAALSQECAGVYSLLGRGEEQADELKSAANALFDAARSHSAAGNHAGAIDCLTASAALSQRCAQIYGVLGYRENQAEALHGAARALSNAADLHLRTGNHADAAEATR